MRLCVAAGDLNRKMFEPVRVERPDPDGSGLLSARAVQKLLERHGSRIVLPSWSEITSLKSFSIESPVPEKPKHAIILVHGLQGKPEDLDYLQKVLWDANVDHSARVVVHATKVNSGKTKDGIQAGGTRVANDIMNFVRDHPELEEISVVGFSLGGIYARYAVGLLYNTQNNRVANLSPRTFITVASPNLGVRGFGVYRFFHENIQSTLSKVFAGRTGSELFMADSSRPLLVQMSEDQPGLPFISALKSFQKRVLYGNVQNDFMVSFGTAVLDPNIVGLKANVTPPADAEIIDHEEDNLGCRVWFSSKPTTDDALAIGHGDSFEEVMSRRLRSIGWETVGVHFDGIFPAAHNLIIAKMRHEFEWVLFTRCGSRSVHHIVQRILHQELDGTP
ncbi:hypothetical protein NDN08_001689 [Rhodosorus marinus]|uniref:DUF676 domain-containing protein n=1 Tax=Rhodosorus marinus TaxID=101924 RepID=A0AAV8URI5_9RHOD|nr:hypothetical protein NDN08_001689 [Rhodosorus marinus]